MKAIIRASTVVAVMLACMVAYADVARSATGSGDTQTAAIADAKNSAAARYGDSITSWGYTHCSSRTIHPNQYDQSVTATVYDCQVDFTTSK
jgi:hypothetical protein